MSDTLQAASAQHDAAIAALKQQHADVFREASDASDARLASTVADWTAKMAAEAQRLKGEHDAQVSRVHVVVADVMALNCKCHAL